MSGRPFLFAALAAAIAAPAAAADLVIEVEDIRSDKGRLMVALHAAGGGFPDQAGAIAGQWAKASPGAWRFVFSGLAAGRYAVAVFHDENGNGKLDTNFVGLPIEGYGFSNDARGNFGPPAFDAAAVAIGDGDGASTTAKLAY